MSWWNPWGLFQDRRQGDDPGNTHRRRQSDHQAIDEQLIEELEGVGEDLHDTADRLRGLTTADVKRAVQEAKVSPE